MSSAKGRLEKDCPKCGGLVQLYTDDGLEDDWRCGSCDYVATYVVHGLRTIEEGIEAWWADWPDQGYGLMDKGYEPVEGKLNQIQGCYVQMDSLGKVLEAMRAQEDYLANQLEKLEEYREGLEEARKSLLDFANDLRDRAQAEMEKAYPDYMPKVEPSVIEATARHDSGAYARCTCCGRYSKDPATLSKDPPMCDCGRRTGWCGSFNPPDDSCKWSKGVA